MKKDKLALLLLILVSILWGFGYVGSAWSLNAGWSVFSILFIRSVICVFFLLIIILVFKHKGIKDKNLWRDGLISGIFFCLGYIFQLYGQLYSNVVNVSLITSTSVIIVPILALLFLKRKPSIPVIIGCIIGMFGSIIISVDSSFKFELGDMFSFLGAISFSMYYIFIDKISSKYNVFDLTLVQFLLMLVMSGIIMLLDNKPFVGHFDNILGIVGLLYYALVSGLICFVLQIWCQKHIEPSTTSLILSFEGPSGALFGVLLLNEILKTKTIIGGLIMLGAILYVQFKELKERRKLENE